MLNTYYIHWIREIKTKIFFMLTNTITIYIIILFYSNQLFSSIIHILNNKWLLIISEKIKNFDHIHIKMYYWSDLMNIDFSKIDKQLIDDSFDWIPSFEFNLGLDSTSDIYLYIQLMTLIMMITPYVLYLIISNLENVFNPKKHYRLFIVFNWVLSIIITVSLILPLLFKIIFHNYLNYLYFEFNIGVELQQYLVLFYKILFTIYLTINIVTLHSLTTNIFYHYYVVRLIYIFGNLYIFADQHLLYLLFILISFFIFEVKNIYHLCKTI